MTYYDTIFSDKQKGNNFVKTIILVLLLCHALLAASQEPSVTLSPEGMHYLKLHPDVRVCVNPAYSPFEVLSLEGKHEGIAADLLRLVAQKTGLKLQIIQAYTKEESLELAHKNECDIIDFITRTPERSQWLLFSKPIFVDQNVLITTEEHPNIEDLHTVVNESIVLSKEVPFFSRLEDTYPNLSVFAVASEEDALLMVLNNKIAITIRPLMVAAHTIKRQGLFNLKVAGTLEGFDSIYRIGVTQNNTQLLDIINQGIAAISSDEREAIITKYAPIMVQKQINLKLIYTIITIVITLIWLILLWNYLLQRKVDKEVKRNLENQKIMLQQAKQAELGSLIGNISHQWREPLSHLSSINLMMIGFLEHQQKIDKITWLQNLKNIENTLDFMSHTMQDFLEFYKPSTLKNSFNVAESIKQTLSIIETNILEDNVSIELKGDMNRDLYGIKNEYMQVWLNIINNALHAFKEKSVNNRKIIVTIDLSMITFCDNARGEIHEETLKKGVGLSMCESILKKYNQKISFRNTGEGVCVVVLLNA